MMASTVPRFRKWLGTAQGPRQDMIYKIEVDTFLLQVSKRSGTLGQTPMSLGWQRTVGAIEADMSTLVDVPAEAPPHWKEIVVTKHWIQPFHARDGPSGFVDNIVLAAWTLGQLGIGYEFRPPVGPPPADFVPGESAASFRKQNGFIKIDHAFAAARKFEISVPAGDGSLAWSVFWRKIEAKLSVEAATALATAAARTDDEWSATFAKIGSDGSMTTTSTVTTGSITVEAVVKSFFHQVLRADGHVDAARAKPAVRLIMDSLPRSSPVLDLVSTADNDDLLDAQILALGEQLCEWATAASLSLEQLSPAVIPAAPGGAAAASASQTFAKNHMLKWMSISTAARGAALGQSRAQNVQSSAVNPAMDALASKIGTLTDIVASQAAAAAAGKKAAIIVSATGDDADASIPPNQLSKVGPEMASLAKLTEGENTEFLRAMQLSGNSNPEIWRTIAHDVSATKATQSTQHGHVREVKRAVTAAAAAFVRADSKAHPDAMGLVIPESTFRGMMKGKWEEFGPHLFSFPVSFGSLAAFMASLFTSDADGYDDAMQRWAAALDLVCAAGAVQFVATVNGIYRWRADGGTTWGWTKQHKVLLTVYVLSRCGDKYKEWLAEPAGSTLPRPSLATFLEWENFSQTLNVCIPAWVQGSSPVPEFVQPFVFDMFGKVLKRSSHAATSAASASDLEASLRKLIAETSASGKRSAASGGADDDDDGVEKKKRRPSGDEKKRRKAEKAAAEKAAAEKTAAQAGSARGTGGAAQAPAAGGGGAPNRQNEAKHVSASVTGTARSGKFFGQLIRDDAAKAVLDKFPSLQMGKQTAVCRGWLACRHCSDEVTDGRCRYGAHSISPRVEQDCCQFVRDLATAEGRDASSFSGIVAADKSD